MTHAERLLLGPGPSNPYPEVMEAFQRPVLGHLDPDFLVVLDEIGDRLRAVFRTANALTLPMSGTGSAGMETCFVNLVEPGDTVIIGVNGVFGERMCEVARRCGAEVVRVDAPWGRAIDPQRLLDAQRAHPRRARARGRARGDVDRCRRTTSRRSPRSSDTDTLLLVDTVTSLGGIPVEVDAWGIDAVYSGTQKCLGVPPGLSPVSFSRARGRARPRPRESAAVVVPRPRPHRRLRRQRAPLPPHRADLDALRAARRASACCSTKDSKRRGRGTRRSARSCRTRCPSSASGCSREERRLPQLTSVWLPDGVDDAKVRGELLHRFDIEVGGGLGDLAGKGWRIGLMGHGAREHSVAALLGALRELL